MLKFQSLIEALEANRQKSDRGIIFISGDKEEKFVSYTELYIKACRYLKILQLKGIKQGNEVLFQIENNEKFLYMFWACLLGGIIPVPVIPGNNDEYRLKVFKVWQFLTNPYLVGSHRIISKLEGFFQNRFEESLMEDFKRRSLFLDEFENAGPTGDIYRSNLDDIAFIQFTSGSTGDPKGIILTHRNLLTNIEAIIHCSKMDERDTFLSWMPLTHDMGMIGCHLVPLTLDINHLFMPASLFIRRPALWLKKAWQHKATLLSSPNFGYRYLLMNLEPDRAKEWDLSNVRLIFNGAEPISPGVCNEFLDKMSNYGLKRGAINTVYGLAEASVAVTFPPPGIEFSSLVLDREHLSIGRPVVEVKDKNDPGTVEFVYVGYPVDNCSVRICNENTVLGDDWIGHIQIKGGNVTPGYYNNKKAWEKVISKDGWLNTGDIGFMRDGQLVVTGRAKDIIFVNGQNYYSHDIERVAGELDGIHLREFAACGVFDRDLQTEVVALFVMFKGKTEDFILPALKIKENINRIMGLHLGKILPVRKMYKTTSGKVQRYKFLEDYRRGVFQPVIDEMDKISRGMFLNKNFYQPVNGVEAKLIEIWKEVLEQEKIDINDNLYEAGVNSLKAIILNSRIQEVFNINISPTQALETPTIKELAQYIINSEEEMYSHIQPVETDLYYPVSSAQKRLLVIEQLEGIGTAYNVPIGMKIDGNVKTHEVVAVFKTIIKRHEILRTTFELIDGDYLQKVHESMEFDIDHIQSDESGIEDIVKRFIRPFSPDRLPLFRAALVSLNKGHQILLLDMHHIITDGLSIKILFEEFAGLYNNKVLPEMSIQYKEYAVWQQKMQNSQIIKKQEEYWLDMFKEEIPVLNMPTDFTRPAIQSFEGDRVRFVIESHIAGGLRKFQVEKNVTLYILLLSAYNILLHKYTSREDIIIGSPIVGRSHLDIENLIGMFVNTVAMRNYPLGSKTIQEFIEEVKRNSLNAYENQDYQFEMLIDKLKLKKDMSRNMLFDAMITLQNMGPPEFDTHNLKFSNYEIYNYTAKVDLALTAIENRDGIECFFEFCTKLFKRETIERISRQFVNILGIIISNPNIKISEIDIAGTDELNQVLFEFNNTERCYNSNKTIHELFEEQVRKTPDHIALIFNKKSVSYRKLNREANRLAHVLRNTGIRPGHIIGILVSRSIDMIVCILGVLKAGGTYLPLDPSYPEERIRYMLEDSKARILLADGNRNSAFGSDALIIKLSDINREKESPQNLQNLNKSTDAAYIIYTSGSTGKPKGVLIEHKSVNNFFRGMLRCVNFSQGKTVLALSTISFDIFVLETLLPLSGGLKVVIADENQQRDPKLLSDLISGNNIDILQFTPSMAQILIHDEDGTGCLKGVKEIIIGGETFPAKLLNSLQKLSTAKIYNAYGPTETTIWSAVKDLTKSEAVTIGRPITNTYIYILDSKNRPQPIGVAGELYISGHGVAREYYNRQELTAQKFLPDPFRPGERMYLTGDLARWLPNGEIEFLGRKDRQVKIRGNRIEPGEIELLLVDYKYIKEAIVLVRADKRGNNSLCAFFACNISITGRELRKYLSDKLPGYMIPSWFIQLEKFPLTPNGKIDRKALLEFDLKDEGDPGYMEGRDEVEKKLQSIWQELLEMKNVNINSSFYELGGHSLKAVDLMYEIYKEFKVWISLKAILKLETIIELADHIRCAVDNTYPAILPVEEKPYYKVSSAQKRMYLIQQSMISSTSYNMTAVMSVDGHIDIKHLSDVFKTLIKRHEVLRTSFEIIDGDLVQKIHKDVDFAIGEIEFSDGDMDKAVHGFISPFDLSLAPLIRVGIIKTNPVKHLLLMDMHHIISDGVSMSIIMREITELYDKKTLPVPEIQYKDYSEWNNRLMDSEMVKEQAEYWSRKLENFIYTGLAAKNGPKKRSSKGITKKRRLDRYQTNRMNDFCRRNKVTGFVFILAAFNLAIRSEINEDDISIAIPVSGRHHSGLESLVGLFLNTLIIRSNIENSMLFKQYLDQVKETVIEAQANQDYPYEELFIKIKKKYSLTQGALFSILFNYLPYTSDVVIRMGDAAIVPHTMETVETKTDIVMYAMEMEKGFQLSVLYDSSLFEEYIIDRLLDNLLHIINAALDNKNILVFEMNTLRGGAENHELDFGEEYENEEFV